MQPAIPTADDVGAAPAAPRPAPLFEVRISGTFRALAPDALTLLQGLQPLLSEFTQVVDITIEPVRQGGAA